jgi:hypothetical protein
MSMETMRYSKENKAKVNFLSRFFGTFNQEILKLWCENENNKDFKYLKSEPSLYIDQNKKPRLDHLIEYKGKNFIVEQKAFYGFQNGNLTKMDDAMDYIKRFDQWSLRKIKEQRSKAWVFFVELDFSEEKEYKVFIKEKAYQVHGKILVWSQATENGKIKFKEKLKLDHILLIEDMISDLAKWQDVTFKETLKLKQSWIDEIFSELLGIKNGGFFGLKNSPN